MEKSKVAWTLLALVTGAVVLAVASYVTLTPYLGH